MPRPRFELLGVEQKGHLVARIYDRKQREELLIRRSGKTCLYWDRRDALVGNRTLRRVAREALERDTTPLPALGAQLSLDVGRALEGAA